MRRSFFTAQALAHQEPVCGDAQTGVMVKTTPVAPFIVMQAQLRLQLLIIAFNPPSALCRGNQCLDRRLLWSRREPVVAGLGLSRRPLDQQPLLVMCLAIVCGTNPHRREPRTERCVAALAPADLPIRPCGQALRDFMYRDRRMCAIAHRSCAGPTALRAGWRHGRRLVRSPPDLRVAADANHVQQAAFAELVSPVGLGAVGRIG